MPSLYELPLTTLSGEPSTLAPFEGDVLLFVNVASKCGFTPQYTGLEALYTRFKGQGFAVLGFPANDFGAQEPGSDAEIATFCSVDYPVSFPLFSKAAVTGEGKQPVYSLLTSAQPEVTVSKGDELRNHLAEFASGNNLPAPNDPPEILWNFEKFLVSRQGEVLARFASDVQPDDPRLVSALEEALSSDTPA